MPRYLEKRRRRWYAALDIPKDVRKHFDGKPRFFRSLGTESLTDAERLVHPVVAGWKAEIADARSGGTAARIDLMREAIETGRRFKNLDSDERSVLEGVIETHADDMAWKSPEQADAFYRIATGASLPTADRLEEWLDRLRNEPKTKDMKRSDVLRFAKRFPYTHEVTRQGVQRWAHELQVNHSLKPKTVGRVISACRGYWDFLQRAGAVDGETDPFKDAVPRSGRKSKLDWEDERKPFAPADVVALIQAARDRGDIELSHLIWLAMWTGCRIEELCALRVSDVANDRFDVADAKSPAGNRTVPVHPALKGLMSHLSATTDDGFILSGLSLNKYGDRSNAIGKRFGRLKMALGFGSQHVFHSIRKTVATQLENAGVPESVAADIIGHEKHTMTYGVYSGGTEFWIMQEALKKLSYPLPDSLSPDYPC